MDIFSKIAEERIKEAMLQGVFDNLQNKGKPLHLEDFSLVPEDLRMAYKILKNAGMIPPELEDRKEIIQLRDLINTIDDDKIRLKKIRELNFKIMKYNLQSKKPLYIEDLFTYEDKVRSKLMGE
ncbi:MAG: DnaJ family domain-containing protein [Thermodesulfovibrionales bacterium]